MVVRIKQFSYSCDKSFHNKVYICDGDDKYLHRDGTWNLFAGDDARFDVPHMTNFDDKVPSLDEAKAALKLIRKYYDQPAIEVSSEMIGFLGDRFIDVINPNV